MRNNRNTSSILVNLKISTTRWEKKTWCHTCSRSDVANHG